MNKPISELVKDEDWQRVRVQLVGNWNLKPNWCINKLQEYLGPVDEASDDQLRIVMNYLTGSGFRTARISSRENHGISDLRASISAEMRKRKFK